MAIFRSTITTWRTAGFLAVCIKTVILLADLWFDFRYKTDTAIVEATVDAATDSASAVHAIRYAPTRSRYFHAVMAELVFPPDSVFVDVGCGKGKVLIMAMDYDFAQVVGVEFSPRLAGIARRNVETYCRKTNRPNNCVIHTTDISTYAIGQHQNVFYLYHPFKRPVMERFLEQLNRSYDAAPRTMWLIYLEPQADCHRLVEKQGGFVRILRIRDLDKAVFVYFRPPRPGEDADHHHTMSASSDVMGGELTAPSVLTKA